MMIKKFLDESALSQLLSTLIAQGRVMAPVRQRGQTMFGALLSPSDWARDLLLPKSGPKAVVFPPRRVIGEATPIPTVLWGVRPCDLQSLAVLDGVFLKEPADEYYKAQRSAITTVALACEEPAATCFCSRVGSHPADAAGADVMLIPVAGGVVAEARTQKGETLLAGGGKDADQAAIAAADSFVKNWQAVAGRENLLPDHLIETFKQDVWDRLGEGCLGCGVCSFLCPTCHCFDICDEGERKVIFWDTCAFPDYSLMTSGENPRRRGESRLRNRLLHKYDYMVRTIGRRGCVGCGRCIDNCPAGLDLVAMLTELEGLLAGEDKTAAGAGSK